MVQDLDGALLARLGCPQGTGRTVRGNLAIPQDFLFLGCLGRLGRTVTLEIILSEPLG